MAGQTPSPLVLLAVLDVQRPPDPQGSRDYREGPGPGGSHPSREPYLGGEPCWEHTLPAPGAPSWRSVQGMQLERQMCGELPRLGLHRTGCNDSQCEADGQGCAAGGHEGVRGTRWYPNTFPQEMNHDESPPNALLPRTTLPSAPGQQ